MDNKTAFPNCVEECDGCFAVMELKNGVKKCSALTKCEAGCHFYKTQKQYKEGLRKYPYNPTTCKKN